jgi:RHS repeat-associated protein
MAVTHYLWDDDTDTVVMEKDDSGTVLAEYDTDPVRFGRLFSMRRGGKTYNYRYDAQGNTRALTDETGVRTDTYRYDAWGVETAKTGNTNNSFRYGGLFGYSCENVAPKFGVRERAYDAISGRWLSTDPLSRTMTSRLNLLAPLVGTPDSKSTYPSARQDEWLSGVDSYRYVGNSPTQLVDPSGLYQMRDSPGLRIVTPLDIMVGNAPSCVSQTFITGTCFAFGSADEWCDFYLHMFRMIVASEGRDPFADLPDCPCRVPVVAVPGGDAIWGIEWTNYELQNPDPDNWKTDNWGVSLGFHPGAAACFRSRPKTSTRKLIGGCRPGQQCCYDSSGRLLKAGAGRGTPDLCSPNDDPSLHNRLDVCPALCCRRAGRIEDYIALWKPNNECPTPPTGGHWSDPRPFWREPCL